MKKFYLLILFLMPWSFCQHFNCDKAHAFDCKKIAEQLKMEGIDAKCVDKKYLTHYGR